MARLALLYDFYGPLLTPRQRRLIEMRYHEDLSLGEIAEATGATRQAAHDLLSRAERALLRYEERLGLAARQAEERAELTAVLRLLGEVLADVTGAVPTPVAGGAAVAMRRAVEKLRRFAAAEGLLANTGEVPPDAL